MDQVLPAGFLFDSDGDFLKFALVSELVGLAARYTAACVAGLSGDLPYAAELFETCQKGAVGRLQEFPQVRHIAASAPKHLAAIEGVYATRFLREWDKTRDRRHLGPCEEHIDKLLQYDPQSEFGLLGKATCAFVLRRDLREAWSCIRKLKQRPTGTWRYSEAFLYLYQGRLDRARA
jgi:hypothetical protein